MWPKIAAGRSFSLALFVSMIELVENIGVCSSGTRTCYDMTISLMAWNVLKRVDRAAMSFVPTSQLLHFIVHNGTVFIFSAERSVRVV